MSMCLMQEEPKLENKSFCCVLLGVSEESKGYRLYDPVAKRVVVSRDVIFEEEKQWDWDMSYREQLLMDLEWGEEESGTDEDEAEENGSDGDETSGNDTEGSGNASSNTTSEEDVNPNERREIQAPIWMRDYVSGEGLSEEENELNMALVAPADLLLIHTLIQLEFCKAIKCQTQLLSINKSFIQFILSFFITWNQLIELLSLCIVALKIKWQI